MTVSVSIEEATQHLPTLLQRVACGEDEVIIARDGEPIARLVSIPASLTPRIPGIDAGKMTVPEDIVSPLPEEVVEEFYK